MKNKFFRYEEVMPGIKLITGIDQVYCYLIEGTKKALLIDTMCGIGDLSEYCKEITKLPITIINTHGHVDHAGGNFSFDEVYIHENDVELMYMMGEVEVRDAYVKGVINGQKRSLIWEKYDLQPKRILKCNRLEEGMQFDLGNKTIEIIHTPGHTQGSISLLDRSNRVLFAGDCCNSKTLLFPPPSIGENIEIYMNTLKKLKKVEYSYDYLLISHGDYKVNKRCVDEAIELCKLIIDNADDHAKNDFLGIPCYLAKSVDGNNRRLDGNTANICYFDDSALPYLKKMFLL